MNDGGGSSAAREEAERIAAVYGRYASEPSKWDLANPGYQALVRERKRAIGNTLGRAGLTPLGERRVLDVGCGNGGELAEMLTFGATPERLVGVDLLADRIEAARSRHPGIDFRVGNAVSLDFQTASFDLVLSYTVFSSILDPGVSRAVAAEMYRVLAPGGSVLWYDIRYPNPANSNVRPLSRREVRRLFPGLLGHLRTLSLLPPLARRLGLTAGWSYPLLAAIPLLRSHQLGLLSKPA